MDEGADSEFYGASIRLKYVTTAAIFFCNIGTGVVMAMSGPAITSFSNLYGTTVNETSKILTVTPACYMISALLSATVLFKYVNRQVAATVVLFVMSIGITILPHMPSLATFLIAGGIYGLAFGVFDPAQLAWIIDIWRHDAGPYILSLYFFYSCGNLIAPLVLEPFLLDDKNTTDSDNSSTTTVSPSEISTELPLVKENSQLYIPFAIAGGIMLSGTIIELALLLYYRNRNPKKTSVVIAAPENSQPNETQIGQISGRAKVVIIVIACFFNSFYQSMEVNTLQFASVFAQSSPIQLTEREGSRVLSAMTFGFAIGRGVGIFLVLQIQPHLILIGNLVLLLLGNTVLFILGGSSVEWMWAGAICLGLGLSTTIAAFFAYLEKYIFISDRIAAFTSVGVGLMISVYPLVLGEWIEDFPTLLNYCDYLNITVLVISFGLLFRLTRYSKGNTTGLKPDTELNVE